MSQDPINRKTWRLNSAVWSGLVLDFMVCYLHFVKVPTSSSSFPGPVSRLSGRCNWVPHSGAWQEVKRPWTLKTSKDGNCMTSLINLLHCFSVETFSLYGQTSSENVIQRDYIVSFLGALQNWLGKTQSNLVWSCMWPCIELEIGLETWFLFPPEFSYDPVKGSGKTTFT